MFIKDFKPNDKIDNYFLVKSCIVKVSTTNNNQYLDIIVMDKTGEIDGKLWRYSEGDEDRFKSGTLVKIKGSVVTWLNANQLRIDKICTEISETIKIEDFISSAPEPGELMLKELKSYIERIKNEDISTIVELIIEDKEDKLLVAPAAMKNHHSIRGGLLYHTTTMLKSAESLCKIYDFLNTDLVYAGVILHDICKIEEMESNELGIVEKYSVEGQIIGHIALGVGEIERIGDKLGADKEVIMLLKHMVLSHHYYPEYGSPKKPMIPEAQILHMLDDLDASLYDMRKALSTTAVGELSENIRSLDNRRVYKSKL